MTREDSDRLSAISQEVIRRAALSASTTAAKLAELNEATVRLLIAASDVSDLDHPGFSDVWNAAAAALEPLYRDVVMGVAHDPGDPYAA